MTHSSSLPVVTPCLGSDVAKEVLQWIGAFTLLTKAVIVSYNMQDYEFWGNGHLSQHLLKQLANGAHVVVLTTPPPGNNGRRPAFRQKLALLETLVRSGAEVYVHEQVHAKAYLFQDDKNKKMMIVGSPNLTARGFGSGSPNSMDLLELALLTGDDVVYSTTSALIDTDLIGNRDTLDFATWARTNVASIAQARGAP